MEQTMTIEQLVPKRNIQMSHKQEEDTHIIIAVAT